VICYNKTIKISTFVKMMYIDSTLRLTVTGAREACEHSTTT